MTDGPNSVGLAVGQVDPQPDGSAVDLVLPNVHEFTRRGMSPAFAEGTLRMWRDVGAAYADLGLFWGDSPNKVVISPRPISHEFGAYVRDQLMFDSITCLSPSAYTSNYSLDIISSASLLADVRSILSQFSTAYARVWGATKSIYKVFKELDTEQISIVTAELPHSDFLWTSVYFDSKAGCRHLCGELGQRTPAVTMPEGYICDSVDDAMEFVAHFRRTGTGTAIKANTGLGGFGTILTAPNESDETVAQRITAAMRDLPYFDHGPVIAERRIDFDATGGCFTASIAPVFVRFELEADGRPSIVGGGSELRDEQNKHVGAELGRGSRFAELCERIRPIGELIASALAQRGYRGQVGVDMVLAGETPYVLEVNLRRSGESHVFDAGRRLFGEDWQDRTYAVTRLPFPVKYKAGPPPIAKVLAAFDKVNAQSGPAVVVLATAVSWMRLFRPGLGYAVFGPDRQIVAAAEVDLREELAQVGVDAA